MLQAAMTSTWDAWLAAQAPPSPNRRLAMVDVPPFADGAVAELRHGADGTVIAEIRIPGPAMVPEWERECIEREARVQDAVAMTTARPGALAESGWYRLTPSGWQRVTDAEAEEEVATTGGWDLVHFRVDGEEVTLW